MTEPWHTTTPLADTSFSTLRRHVVFHGAKWDAQVGDVCTVARAPIVLRKAVWSELSALAEQLDAELGEMEIELLGRPELLSRLGLPRALLRHLPGRPAPNALRIRRYDFHFTDGGVRVSEVNSDVPGGLHEGVTAKLYAEQFPGTSVPGNVASEMVNAIASRIPSDARVALVHATAYSDDRQVMTVLQRELARVGLQGIPCAPDHLRWDKGCSVALGDARLPVAAIVRFFPAEWLPACPRESRWPELVRSDVLLCNPVTSVVVQSKRLPLLWDRLRAPSSTWRRALPETRPPWSAPWPYDDRWLLKPVLGRVGQDIVGRGRVPSRTFARVAADAIVHPMRYVAQRRFRSVPFVLGNDLHHACIGVFTLDGRVVGAYGRTSPGAFIDHRAIDTPVLVADDAWKEPPR